MRKLVTGVAVLAVLALAVATVEAAPAGKWRTLGKRTVTDRVDHDVIRVGVKRSA